MDLETDSSGPKTKTKMKPEEIPKEEKLRRFLKAFEELLDDIPETDEEQ